MSAICSAIGLAEDSLYDLPRPLMRPVFAMPQMSSDLQLEANPVQDKLRAALAQYAFMGALTRELKQEFQTIIEDAEHEYGSGLSDRALELRRRRRELSGEIKKHFDGQRKTRAELLNLEIKDILATLSPVNRLKIRMCLELLSLMSNRRERLDMLNEIAIANPQIGQHAAELEQIVCPALEMCDEYEMINQQIEQGRIFLSRCRLVYAEMLIAEADKAMEQRDSIMSGLHKHAARGILNDASMQNAALLKDPKFLELAWKAGLGKN